METLALLATLEAKPGKEQAVADMLQGALQLAQAEAGTVHWYALQMSPTIFGIFDTFENEDGRQAHLNGPIAKALMEHADELLASPPDIKQVTLLAAK